MIKKMLSVIIIFLMFIGFYSQTLRADVIDEENNVYSNYYDMQNLVQSRSEIQIELSEEYSKEPIKPSKSTVSIPIVIKNINLGIFAQRTTKYCNRKGKTQTVTLSIGDIPDWCTVTINPTVLNFKVNTEFEVLEAELEVLLGTEAPAFKIFNIPVIATSEPIKGMFKLPKVSGCTVTKNIALTPDYFPLIDVVLPYNYKKISTSNTTNIPIKITNLGNGKSSIIIEPENQDNSWQISYPKDIILEPDEQKEIILKVKPSKDFIKTTFLFSIKSRYFAASEEDTNIESLAYNYKIYFESEDKIYSSSSMINIIIIIIAIVILISLYIIIKRRRKLQ